MYFIVPYGNKLSYINHGYDQWMERNLLPTIKFYYYLLPFLLPLRFYYILLLFYLVDTLKKLGSYIVVLLKIIPFMYEYYCRTDIDEAGVISFLGVQTDDFGILTWKHVATQKISAQN